MPDIEQMRRDIFSVSVSNEDHYKTIKEVYESFKVILDPHGSVGWKALEIYLNKKHDRPSVVYETADPGKFPDDIRKAIGITPPVPEGIKKQSSLPERIYTVESSPSVDSNGTKRMSQEQYMEVKEKVREILKKEQ